MGTIYFRCKRSNVYINNHYLKPYKLENIENELKYYKNDIDNEKIKQILDFYSNIICNSFFNNSI